MTRPTAQQVRILERALVAKRKILLRDAHEELMRWSTHPMEEIAGEAPDAADNALAATVTDLDHSLLQQHVDAIRDTDAALARMRQGCYGSCVDCGDDIAYERLAAFPTAKRCIACQQRHERTYADSGDPGATL